MKRRSPYEKKQLSYAEDRRNEYGESDKGSRRSIPRRKRTVNRGNRRREQALGLALGPLDLQAAELGEHLLVAAPPKRWRKVPDVPLATSLSWRRDRRDRRAGRRQA